ncbi:hypothetical protein ONZ45_g2662 [Pleurotus djamor]|nr:hypothetical protein ONZ45_g2662 [Pleurotus djamor]
MFAYLLATFALAAVTIVHAQTLPACAKDCLNSTSSSCSSTDILCLCNNSTLVANVVDCARSSCQGADFNSAASGAVALCAAVGVTLSSLPTGTASANATSMTASSSSTGSATTSAMSSLETSNGAAAMNPIQAIAGVALFGFAALAL